MPTENIVQLEVDVSTSSQRGVTELTFIDSCLNSQTWRGRHIHWYSFYSGILLLSRDTPILFRDTPTSRSITVPKHDTPTWDRNYCTKVQYLYVPVTIPWRGANTPTPWVLLYYSHCIGEGSSLSFILRSCLLSSGWFNHGVCSKDNEWCLEMPLDILISKYIGSVDPCMFPTGNHIFHVCFNWGISET